jgi:ATP synthase F1 complex assembly factor 2
MKIALHPATKRPLFSASLTFRGYIRTERSSFHNRPPLCAVAHPITAHGPPPKAPVPAPEFGERVERRKKQAELIERAKEARTQQSKPSSALKKRFWKHVHVTKIDGMD